MGPAGAVGSGTPCRELTAAAAAAADRPSSPSSRALSTALTRCGDSGALSCCCELSTCPPMLQRQQQQQQQDSRVRCAKGRRARAACSVMTGMIRRCASARQGVRGVHCVQCTSAAPPAPLFPLPFPPSLPAPLAHTTTPKPPPPPSLPLMHACGTHTLRQMLHVAQPCAPACAVHRRCTPRRMRLQ